MGNIVDIFNKAKKKEINSPWGEQLRELALQYAWKYLGTWYKWGGDDPDGFDCSGFMVEVLTGVGLLPRRSDFNAQQLFNKFSKNKVEVPYEGCLVYWGKDNRSVIHVEMMINERIAIGASGGTSKTINVQTAIEHNAFIKIRDCFTRSQLLGWNDPFMDIK